MGIDSHLYGTRELLKSVSTLPKTVSFECNTWYSQAHQDQFVFDLLHGKTNGYFVDIATNDAIHLSNSFGLETHYNWDGICIEDNPQYWPSLSHRRCHIVGAVVGNDREQVEFAFKNVAGGIVGNQFDNKKTKSKSTSNVVQPRLTVPLLEILQRLKAPLWIDYLSLDVEGAEDIVLQADALDKYHFRLITVERPSDALTQLLHNKGYEQLRVLTIFRETLFAHTTIVPELNRTALESVDLRAYRNSSLIGSC